MPCDLPEILHTIQQRSLKLVGWHPNVTDMTASRTAVQSKHMAFVVFPAEEKTAIL